MSVSWDAIDQRTRQKQENDRALKDFLLVQQAESKNRKLAEKRNDMAEYQKSSSLIGANNDMVTINHSSNLLIQLNSHHFLQRNAYPPQDRSFYPPTNNPYATQPLQQPTMFSSPYPPASNLTVAQMQTPRLNAYGTNLLTQQQQPKDMQYTTSSVIPTTSKFNTTFKPPEPQPQPQQQQQYFQSDTPSFQAASAITDDFVAKLRFTEEQLQNERRSRGWLEAEVQVGKSQIATLTAKVEKLTEMVSAESVTMKEVARQADQADRKATQLTQEMGMKLEKGQLKLHTIVSDLVARQKTLEYHDSEEGDKQRLLADEINALRYKVESFSLMASEVGSEVRSKAKDLEHEQQRSADALRVIRDHDHALDSLHHAVGASADALAKKMDMALLELRQRVDAEARARFQFEGGMRDLYAEMRKVLSAQDRDATDRIESARLQASVAFDRERMDRERTLALVMDDLRAMDKSVKDALSATSDKIGSQLMAVDDTVSQEKINRAKFEAQIKTEVEDGFKIIQQAVLKKFEEMQHMQTDMRQSVGSAIKALKESVSLVERTSDQKLSSIEEVLRAEIRSRMETDRVITDIRSEQESTSVNIERRAMSAIAEAVEESRESAVRLEDELKKTTEQLIASKTRSIDDLETQMELLRKRIVESDTETTAKIRLAHVAVDQMGRSAQASLEAFESRVDVKFSTELLNVDELSSKLKQAETNAELMKQELEEKLNFRALQNESTMSAFKEELELRLTKTDAADLEARLDASLSAVKGIIAGAQVQVMNLRDDLELKCAKKELEETESRFKALNTAVNTRISEIDETIIGLKEDVSDKTTRKELEDHESNLKTAILNLQLKDVSLDEAFEALKTEVSEKATKKSLADQDDRMKNMSLETETKLLEWEESLRSVQENVSLRATSLELEDSEKRVSEIVFSLQDKIGDVSTAIAEAKTEISQTMHDDVEEMVASINGALDSVQARTDKIENSVETMKLRVSESENSSRSRIQMFTSTVETLVSENSLTISKTKDIFTQQVKELHEKLEGFPKEIRALEVQIEDFKKRWTDQSRAETERVEKSVADVRESLARKADELTIEQLHSDLVKSIQKISAQQDVEAASLEQTKLSLHETEETIRERLREFRATLEKGAEDQASTVRLWRETYSKRIEELDSRTSSIPKALDQMWGELRKLKFDIEERVRSDIAHLEKELNATKAETSTKVNNKGLDAAVSISVSPLNSRLDRLGIEISDLRILTSKLQGEVGGRMYGGGGGYNDYTSSNPSGVNIHKPTFFDQRGKDPNLERIVDLAENRAQRPASGGAESQADKEY
ncbi:hypothetical protein HDU81_007289 [Chytriomyces hyalinus]|nr:hypothetical protein HDU81_007289 [Chytriomyces hyalinus]